MSRRNYFCAILPDPKLKILEMRTGNGDMKGEREARNGVFRIHMAPERKEKLVLCQIFNRLGEGVSQTEGDFSAPPRRADARNSISLAEILGLGSPTGHPQGFYQGPVPLRS